MRGERGGWRDPFRFALAPESTRLSSGGRTRTPNGRARTCSVADYTTPEGEDILLAGAAEPAPPVESGLHGVVAAAVGLAGLARRPASRWRRRTR